MDARFEGATGSSVVVLRRRLRRSAVFRLFRVPLECTVKLTALVKGGPKTTMTLCGRNGDEIVGDAGESAPSRLFGITA
jgi:hypothetical protein